MSTTELARALELYERLHGVLMKANRLPIDDVRRFEYSLEYIEIRTDLLPLLEKHQGLRP